MNATRVTLVWYPHRQAPPNTSRFVAALERAIPRRSVTVRLARTRYGWTVTHACAGDPAASSSPLEYKAPAVWALQSAGLVVQDCPVCADPVEVMGTELRPDELRARGVAPDRTHAHYYGHKHAAACTPVDVWARFSIPCRCGAPLRFVVKASESIASGGALACECGAQYALEAKATGAGIAIEATGR